MISDKIKQIMKEKNIKAVELAEYLGMRPQNLNTKFKRDSWSVQDLISVLDFMGCNLTIEYKQDTKLSFTTEDAIKKDGSD